MGGRETGGLATQLAAHMSFAPDDVDRVRRFWNAPRMAARPGLKAVELFDAALDGRVKALWILGTNPASSMPRASRVRAALAACPFVVVTDCWPNDTTAWARVVLPAAGWGEKDGTVTNSERRISRQRPIRPAPGEARPDWWMLTQVARRMGWEAAFGYRRPADIFREHAALSAFENHGSRAFDIGALADIDEDGYERLAPVQWPLRRGSPHVVPHVRLFADGGFPAEGGRARFIPTPWRALTEQPDERRPLLLNTGRVRDQWHTMTRTGSVPRLMQHVDAPFLNVNPDDGRRVGLADGDLARVESRHGAAILRVRLSDDQRPGETFAAMHWTDQFASCGPIDRLVGSGADPVSGQPALKATPVSLEPIVPHWHGLLLRGSDASIGGDLYWSRFPVATGHVFELAGFTPLADRNTETDSQAHYLLAAPAGSEIVVYADAQRGSFRYASVVNGKLEACLYIAQSRASLPDRRAIASLLGSVVAPDARAGLVAPRPLITPPTQTGPIVCACFAVGLAAIRQVIAEQRDVTVGRIGSLLRAGTHCGSCIPELKNILRREQSGDLEDQSWGARNRIGKWQPTCPELSGTALRRPDGAARDASG
jgi:assimilatory nitrate reductase catalytic subunit